MNYLGLFHNLLSACLHLCVVSAGLVLNPVHHKPATSGPKTLTRLVSVVGCTPLCKAICLWDTSHNCQCVASHPGGFGITSTPYSFQEQSCSHTGRPTPSWLQFLVVLSPVVNSVFLFPGLTGITPLLQVFNKLSNSWGSFLLIRWYWAKQSFPPFFFSAKIFFRIFKEHEKNQSMINIFITYL